MSPKHQIAVLDRGFVYVGTCTIADGFLTITSALNICRWGTSNGLGELAQKGPQSATRLDAAGTVTAPLSAVMHLLDTDAALWASRAVAA